MCTNLAYPSQRLSPSQTKYGKALFSKSVKYYADIPVVWPCNGASFFSLFFYFYKLSMNWEEGHHFCISYILLTFVQLSACASSVIDL